MNRITSRRILALLACAALVLFSVLTTTLAILHGGRECSGHDCAICAQLHYVAGLLKQLSAAFLGILLLPALFSGGILFLTAIPAQAGMATLVQWKVRMNH